MKAKHMKLLLTSGGVTNASIHRAFVDLLGKPIETAHALLIPTAAYGHPAVHPENVRNFIAGTAPNSLASLGWASVGVLELTALSSISAARWHRWLADADVLLVDGGDAVYLAHWLRESGVAEILKTRPELVCVGISAGSMVMAPRVGDFFTQWEPATGHTDRTLGFVDFAIFPHLGLFAENNLPNARKWVRQIGLPGFVLDEQSAVQVVDGQVTIISEGDAYYLTPESSVD